MESEIHSSMTDPKNSQANSTGLTSEKVSTCNEASKPWIQYELGSSDSAKNGEHWIKTDEDCKNNLIHWHVRHPLVFCLWSNQIIIIRIHNCFCRLRVGAVEKERKTQSKKCECIMSLHACVNCVFRLNISLSISSRKTWIQILSKITSKLAAVDDYKMILPTRTGDSRQNRKQFPNHLRYIYYMFYDNEHTYTSSESLTFLLSISTSSKQRSCPNNKNSLLSPQTLILFLRMIKTLDKERHSKSKML
ncbi:hypothetical protein YC2023_034567 [Brassica napus]